MGGVLKISAVRLYPKLLEEAPPGNIHSVLIKKKRYVDNCEDVVKSFLNCSDSTKISFKGYMKSIE
jgi:hypothetical protein